MKKISLNIFILFLAFNAFAQNNSENNSISTIQHPYLKKGFISIWDIGLIPVNYKSYNTYSYYSSYYNQKSIYNIYILNGYQFKQNFSVCAGTGFQMLNVPYIPVFADIRYTVFKGKTTPFIFCDAGYTFAFNKYDFRKDKTGTFVNSGIGIKNYFSNRTAIMFSIGWWYQQQTYSEKTNYWIVNNNDMIETKSIYNRINIRLGFYFN